MHIKETTNLLSRAHPNQSVACLGNRSLYLILISLLIFFSASSFASLTGEKEVFLIEKNGSLQKIATVEFTAEGKGYRYSINLDAKDFDDQFLSMRPFKCLMGSEQVVCYVPYPYKNQKHIEAGDLVDLEYDLLFLHKHPTEYGINLWNGMYYALEIEGDTIKGKLHELDMNLLSAPPEDGNIRPISRDDIFEADADSQRYPELLIR